MNRQLEDHRQFVPNGLLAVGEVTANDIWRHRQNGNFVVIQSPCFTNTYYVVFRRTATPQNSLRQWMRDDLVIKQQLARLAAQRSIGHFGRRTHDSAAVLTGTDLKTIFEIAWARQHPASRAVDNASADLFISLLEMNGDRLQHRLHELGVLTDVSVASVNLKRLDEVLDYEAIGIYNKAIGTLNVIPTNIKLPSLAGVN